MSGIWIVAEETMRRVAAAKATFAFAIAFSLLSLAVSYFGLAGYHAAGFQGFGRVTSSLFNLVVYLVPLLALILGTAEIAGRREALALVLAQPVGRLEVILGSYLGLAAGLAAALVAGLGSAGALILLQTSAASLGAYAILVLLSLILLLAFLAVSFLLGVIFLDRLRSLAAAILVWFACVVGYDLALIGITSALRGLPLKSFLLPAILLNPVDMSRVLVTLAGGRGALFGPAGATLVETFGRPGGAAIAILALLFQVGAPLLIAFRIFKTRDL
jgi:Cu-processing system permease protein